MLNYTEILLASAKPKPQSLNQPPPDKPMRLLVLGDFSCDRLRTTDRENGDQLIEKIDIDNFAYILAKIKPELYLTLDKGLSNIIICFTDIDDFHPDVLFSKLDIFARFSRMR